MESKKIVILLEKPKLPAQNNKRRREYDLSGIWFNGLETSGTQMFLEFSVVDYV